MNAQHLSVLRFEAMHCPCEILLDTLDTEAAEAQLAAAVGEAERIEAKYSRVTKEDIQRVARTYLKDTNRTVVTTVPKRAAAPTTGSN